MALSQKSCLKVTFAVLQFILKCRLGRSFRYL